MTYPYMPRIKLFRDNQILRPNAHAEARSRKTGTAKRVGAAMAARLVKRLG